MFADKVEIEVKAGKGGNGKLSFRQERYKAKGGPDGGDGGRGGDVVIEVDHNTNTLSKYRTNRLVKAGDGQGGEKNDRHGKAGQKVVIKVPIGTMVRQGDQKIIDLVTNGQTAVLAKGGRGGFGNAHFTSSSRQVPRVAELGEAGETRKLIFELKLVADAGLIGLPNSGKSTLLSVISNAKPEIADYPFTTLIPNLGVVDFEDYTFLAADIPGLIEGASQGKGLGDEFLRHIERTAVLWHLIDATSSDVVKDYQTVIKELLSYTEDLSQKPQLVVLTKIDAVSAEQLVAIKEALKPVLGGQSIFEISAVSHRGLDKLLRAAVQLIQQARQEAAALEPEPEIPVIDQSNFPSLWKVEPADGAWEVSGGRIESFAARTVFDNPDAVERLRDILKKLGIARELKRLGAKPGDTIKIGPSELEF